MTPQERNRVRHLRDQLAQYERMPDAALARAIERTAGELREIRERLDREARNRTARHYPEIDG